MTFDVSLPIPAMNAYVGAVQAALAEHWPDLGPPMVFGHLGDGNLHIIARVPALTPEHRHRAEMIVYPPLTALGGSISAEHGIGLQKRDHLDLTRSPAEIALMRRLKTALDPRGILNPGKIIA